MSTNFPTSLDTFTNPQSTDQVSTVDHAAQHSNANDSIAALEAKVGANSSAVTTSFDYKLGEVTGSDKAVGKSASQTLTNKTLTTPIMSTISVSGQTVTLPAATDTLVGKATTDSLTNKTITDSTNNVMAKSLKSATTTVDVSAATAPSSGQVLTATSSTTATWQSPSGAGTVKTIIPKPQQAWGTSAGNAMSAFTTNSNTTMYVGLVTVTQNITVNNVTIVNEGVNTSGTVKVGLYSEDGQTQLFGVTTATISASGPTTTAVSSVAVTAGNYYIAIVPVSTTSINFDYFLINDGSGLYTVSGKTPLEGSITVSAGTLPSTFTPTSISHSGSKTLYFRLDN